MRTSCADTLPQTRLSQGFSLVEMIVGIGIVLTLVALLSAAVKTGIESGRRASCLSNLRQIGAAMAGYSGDNNGRMPFFRQVNAANTNQSDFWFQPNQWLQTYGANGEINTLRRLMRCSSDSAAKNPVSADYYSYTANYYVLQYLGINNRPIDTARRPVYYWECQNYVALADGNEKKPYNKLNGSGAFSYTPGGPLSDQIGDRHSGGINVLFGGGNVQWMAHTNFWQSNLHMPPGIRDSQ